MADFAHDIDAQRRLRAIEKKMAGGSPPSDNDGMEMRVKSLEEAVKNLPTKTDFAELRADMAEGREAVHKLLLENARWTHTALLGMISVAVIGILGLLLTIWNTAKQHPQQQAISQPAQQQPIIINVPQPAPAPAEKPPN
ncbi:hypothetical protein N0K08_17525 [Acidovorax sp. Be4]|uniref:DUF3618 domain-containing protein n=1 Tax=Acidovorax bellezanensis TaxID=2976702 RepID=A0ABT2PT42_9BURK|nr:hypothetical protein [Acidovorax sp. Be4]MCT9812447.1 hypothetical protein [Acidovorax sp. Be4]